MRVLCYVLCVALREGKRRKHVCDGLRVCVARKGALVRCGREWEVEGRDARVALVQFFTCNVGAWACGSW